MSEQDIENIKIAVAIRMGRTALGISQQTLADLIGISKITLARIETLESKMKTEFYIKAIKVFREFGVELDATSGDGLTIDVSPLALHHALNQLQDTSQRRSDRKK